jgi:hypothetical protein
MKISDWLQTGSLMAVAITLLITAVHSRQAIKQTQHLARQTGYVQETLKQGAYQSLNSTQDTLSTAFFKDDASMLR